MEDTTKLRRPWFRFSLRTLLVLVTLVAIPLSWVAFQLRWIRQREEMLKSGALGYQESGIDPPFPLHLFGARKGYRNLVLNHGSTRTELRAVLALFPEAYVQVAFENGGAVFPDFPDD